MCDGTCVDDANEDAIVAAAQISQDAQAGYACDYQNKRGPRAWNEIKECRKGHHKLAADVAHERPQYIGKRHVTRLCSDAYNKGVVRSAQERANLNANKKDNDVLAAETVRTAQTEGMPGRDLVTWREHLTSGGEQVS